MEAQSNQLYNEFLRRLVNQTITQPECQKLVDEGMRYLKRHCSYDHHELMVVINDTLIEFFQTFTALSDKSVPIAYFKFLLKRNKCNYYRDNIKPFEIKEQGDNGKEVKVGNRFVRLDQPLGSSTQSETHHNIEIGNPDSPALPRIVGLDQFLCDQEQELAQIGDLNAREKRNLWIRWSMVHGCIKLTDIARLLSAYVRCHPEQKLKEINISRIQQLLQEEIVKIQEKCVPIVTASLEEYRSQSNSQRATSPLAQTIYQELLNQMKSPLDKIFGPFDRWEKYNTNSRMNSHD